MCAFLRVRDLQIKIGKLILKKQEFVYLVTKMLQHYCSFVLCYNWTN